MRIHDPVPSRTNLFGAVFLLEKSEPNSQRVAHAGERKADDDAGNDRQNRRKEQHDG